jgi:prophage tail gpP-like protein
MQHDVSLTLGGTGTECDVWDGYRVELGIFIAGAPWSFELWRSADARSAWDQLAPSVRPGDWIRFAIDEHPQLVAQIDARARGGDRRGGIKLVMSGRDLAAAAIDSDADPRIHLSNTTLEDAANAMLEPLGIPLLIGANAQAARDVQTALRPGPHGASTRRPRRQRVGRFHPKPGEKIWHLLVELCRRVGLLCWPTIASDRTLAIAIDTPDYDQAATFVLQRREVNGVVAQDDPIIAGTEKIDIAGIPTEVFVCGHNADGDTAAGRFRAWLGNGGLFFDGRVNDALGARPRWIESTRATTQDHATQDAARVICDANRKLRLYECTVQGHGQMIGGRMRLFAINTVARIRDTAAGIDEDMYIERVTFHGSRNEGQLTDLVLHPLHAVQLVPAEP